MRPKLIGKSRPGDVHRGLWQGGNQATGPRVGQPWPLAGRSSYKRWYGRIRTSPKRNQHKKLHPRKYHLGKYHPGIALPGRRQNPRRTHPWKTRFSIKSSGRHIPGKHGLGQQAPGRCLCATALAHGRPSMGANLNARDAEGRNALISALLGGIELWWLTLWALAQTSTCKTRMGSRLFILQPKKTFPTWPVCCCAGR